MDTKNLNLFILDKILHPAYGWAMKFTDLVATLETNGFFDLVNKASLPQVRQKVLSGRYLFPEEVKRSHFADAEDLTEQGVLDFIAELSHELALRGVHLPVVPTPLRPSLERSSRTGQPVEVMGYKLKVDDMIPDPPGVRCLRPAREEAPQTGEYYRVTIGSRSQEIWNKNLTPAQYWEAGMSHAFLLINQLLEDAGAPERIYGLHGGNDGQAVFLTPTQFNLIQWCEEIKDTEKPWEAHIVN